MAGSYHKAGATTAMRNVPRFGHSDEFSQVFASSNDATDYILGLIFFGAFCFAIFLLWSIMLLVFKSMGSHRVGFFAGGPFVKPVKMTKEFRSPFIVRVIFVNCGFLFIVFSILFVTEGLTNIQSTIDTMSENTREAQAIVNSADAIFQDMQVLGQRAFAAKSVVVAKALDTEFCLNDPDLSTQTNYSLILSSVVDVLGSLGDFLGNKTKELDVAVNQTNAALGDTGQATENIASDDWQSLVIIIPYILVPTALLIGVFMAWFGVHISMYKCLMSWFFLPIFVIQTIFAYTLSCVIIVAASGNADFCSGGDNLTPDATLIDIMAVQGYTEADLVYRIASFYITECVKESPFEFLSVFEDQLLAAKGNISIVFDVVDANSTNQEAVAVTAFCGASLEPFQVAMTELKENMGRLAGSASASLSLLRCDNILPLYTDTFYNGTCTYSIKGVTWAFAAFMVVGCMGLVMIMLRSAWQDVLTPMGHASDYAKELDVVYDDDEHPVVSKSHVEPASVTGGYEENYGTDPINPYGDQESIMASTAAYPMPNTTYDEGTLASGSVYTSSPSSPYDGTGYAPTLGSASVYTTDYTIGFPSENINRQ